MKLVEAGPDHIPALARSMRADDVRECAALGRSPGSALEHGLRSSLWAITAIEGEPVAMLGVSPRSMLEGVGVPWMLGSDRIYDNAKYLLSAAAGVLAEMHATFPRLENVVAADNDRALRFLRWAGFEIQADPWIVAGVPFVRFARYV